MLPNWSGAAECYARSYALLERWGACGHVTRQKIPGRRKGYRCSTSGEMDSLIEALNRGDEEAIKATLLVHYWH